MNILLTSVGRRGYLVDYFKEVLNSGGEVHVSNSSSINPSFSRADKSVVTPLIYDKEYIPFLKKYCRENKIDILISLFDIDVYILSLHKEEFKELGVKLIVSNSEFVKVCNDKWLTYNYLKENGFNVPKTYINIDDALLCLNNKEIDYPVIVKPRWGMGSISIFEADNEEELIMFYKKIKKDISNSYLKYESLQDVDNSVIIQEKLKGNEHGLDIINDLDGNFRNVIIKQKYGMRSGETDCAKVINNDNIFEMGKRLSNITRHIGNLDVDVFVVDDKCYILEMNARFGGGYPFSHIAGVNLPLAIVKWCKNEQVEDDILSAEYGVMAHKDIEIVRI